MATGLPEYHHAVRQPRRKKQKRAGNTASAPAPPSPSQFILKRLSSHQGPVSAKFAVGGPSITERSRFAKGPPEPSREGKPLASQKSQFLDEPDTFRTDIQRTDYEKKTAGGEKSDTEGDSKKLPTIKPRT